jgi:hypothetical protein
MRVLVAGADGVRALGAEPLVVDALDRDRSNGVGYRRRS